MKDKTLWTIVLLVAVFSLLYWLGIGGDDLVDSVRRASRGRDNLLGWGVFALVAFTVYRIVNLLTRY